MTIELTKRESELLLELVHLGEDVVNGPRAEDRRSREHQAVAEKVYEAAEGQGLGYLADEGRPTEALLSRIDLGEYRWEYDDWVFWDELAIRLAERDLMDEIGREAYERMPEADRKERVDALAAEYDKEFDKQGVARLRLDVRRERRAKRDTLTERLKKLFDDGKDA
jgi:hypothetical protein